LISAALGGTPVWAKLPSAVLMRKALRRVLDEEWILVLAAGIALGYTLLNLAEAIGSSITTAVESQPPDQLFASGQAPLAFTVSDHVIDLGPIARTAIAFVIVLGAVTFILSRFPRRARGPST
jgi:NADPH:quinone reductase-like Zn-dependent oxidoreductase